MSIDVHHLRFAVVDDDHLILEVFASLMHQSNYHADFFSTFDQAYKAITAHPGRYDLLITDIFMPDGNGIDFAKKIRVVFPDIPILFMTGSGTDELKQQALNLGRVSFLEKPFHLSSVLEGTIVKFLSDK